MLPVLYFAHIPRTAGTSLAMVLDGLYRAEQICPARLWADWPGVADRPWSLYRGHFGGAGLDPWLPPSCQRISVLRDPLTLARSRYAYVLRDPNTALHARVRKSGLDFAGFLADPQTAWLVSNPQCRFLSLRWSDRHDPVAALAGLCERRDQYVHEQRIDESPEQQFEQARAWIDRALFVGLVEQLDWQLPILGQRLGVELSTPMPRLNASLAQATADPGCDARIRELNEWDLRLYEYVQARWQG